MKRKLFTISHNLELLKQIGHQESLFTAEEHAYVIEREFSDKFESRESVLRWYLSENAAKLSALGFLIHYVYRKGFKNIISLGAGASVLESLLKDALPDDAIVVATDFDTYFV